MGFVAFSRVNVLLIVEKRGIYIIIVRNKKAKGDDDVPGDVLKLFGESGLKIMTKLINTIYETGE